MPAFQIRDVPPEVIAALKRRAAFRTVIAEITPEELESFRSHPETLPKGWNLSQAERFVRPEPS